MPEQRYRVLVICTHPVQYAAPVFRQMARHSRLEIQVAYCSLQGAEAGVDPEFGREVKWDVPLLDGYPWIQVPNRSPRPGLGHFFGLINPGLWKLVGAGNYDVVVAYMGYAYLSFWIALAAAKLHRKPILFGTDATGVEPLSRSRWKVPLKKIMLPPIFGMATMALAPSAATAEYLRSLGVDKERIAATLFVADNDYWEKRAAQVDRAAVRASWGISQDAPVVVFCAKLQPWKRPQDVLRAFTRAGLPDARLVMAGDGPMLAELQAEARNLGCAGRVKFLGFMNQTELPALYRAADVMVLSSEYDACPVVVCEAMLCGCPVILSDKIRGRAELVRPAETGYYYPCGDVEALATLLRQVLSNREQLQRMSEAARERMQTYSPRDNVEVHVRAVEKAIDLMRQGAAA